MEVQRIFKPTICLTIALLSFLACAKDRGSSPADPPKPFWTKQASGTAHTLSSVCWAGDRFAAVGYETMDSTVPVLTSPDGTQWSVQSYPWPQWNNFREVVWTGSSVFAAGFTGVFRSPNGLAYAQLTSAPQLAEHVYWTGSDLLVNAPNAPRTHFDAMAWLNDSTWVKRGEYPMDDQTLSRFNGLWVFAGHRTVQGTGPPWIDSTFLYSSPDLLTWTLRLADAGNFASAFAYSPSRIVAAGDVFYSSTDGVVWEKGNLQQPCTDAIVWTGALFVTAGCSGFTYTSPDGVTWQEVPKADNSIYGLAYNGTTLVAVGVGGYVWTAMPNQ
jgi:hypothetical protein